VPHVSPKPGPLTDKQAQYIATEAMYADKTAIAKPCPRSDHKGGYVVHVTHKHIKGEGTRTPFTIS